MTYRLPSLGRHFCPVCLSYGEHYPGCPEAIDRDPPIDEGDYEDEDRHSTRHSGADQDGDQ